MTGASGAERRTRGLAIAGRIEWRTVLLALLIYGSWMAVTWWHARLPLWALIPIGGWLIAWQGSLQHETIHGHPTGVRLVDGLIGGIPLSLWLPYAHYRRTHLAHHRAKAVTDPFEDPEARYLPAGSGIAGRARHLAESAQASLAGRLLIGPPLTIGRFLLGELARSGRDPVAVLREWLPHLAGVALVGWWLATCRMPFTTYLVAFLYPGTALSLLRSFAEHRAHDRPGHRVAVVERAGPFALLFLHNNLHATHHLAPNLAWYRLPAFHRRHRARILRHNGGLLYSGYQDVARRYLLRAHDALVHPDHRPPAGRLPEPHRPDPHLTAAS